MAQILSAFYSIHHTLKIVTHLLVKSSQETMVTFTGLSAIVMRQPARVQFLS